MAIAQNDANKVTDILRRFPGSLAELNIYGQSPLHLAAAKPQILRLLVEAANLSLLSQIDGIGFTALETAMLLSGTQCMNKSNLSRCRQCACTQCVEILLEAGCSARMHTNERLRGPLSLGKILSPVSELARRRYIYHMKELRDYQLRQFPSDQLLSTKRRVGKTDTTPPQKGSEMYNRNNEEVWSWVYNELDDPHHAELFYRHGFRPHLSLFIHLQQRSITYTSWLVEHSADLFPRSPDGPHLIENSPNTGVISVRYVFYILGHRITRLSSAAFERLGLAVRRRNLTDGCRCNCSTIGCNPFIWMMKGMMERGGKYNAERYASHMFDYFSKCDHQLIALTYTAAIRIATFQALGLTHTCCNPPNAAEGDDDVDNINEEQASLLEFHEELVVEFEKEALKFINYEHDGCQSFPDFWMTCWIARVKEVLDKLDGDKLTDEERKGAEDIGVRWCEPVLEKQKRPYNIRSLEYYMHELDLIFPEYNQPWPEDLNQNLS
ncbi:hypothetical protein M426DRAFT_151662 [Hypoxylon sp. CI-4A]|nr:hypothetical protein M426DRAFT_151662 [Hypoxylon sp. CI-4A]